MRGMQGTPSATPIASARQIIHLFVVFGRNGVTPMFVRIVWQEGRKVQGPDLFRGTVCPAKRGINFFPTPGADMRAMTLGLFDR